VPVWLHDVDPLTIAHSMGAADDMRQVDRVIGQRGERGLQSGPFGRIRGVVVDWFVGWRRNIGNRVHVLRIPAAKLYQLGRSDKAVSNFQ
jgi:hypothetical protein